MIDKVGKTDVYVRTNINILCIRRGRAQAQLHNPGDISWQESRFDRWDKDTRRILRRINKYLVREPAKIRNQANDQDQSSKVLGFRRQVRLLCGCQVLELVAAQFVGSPFV